MINLEINEENQIIKNNNDNNDGIDTETDVDIENIFSSLYEKESFPDHTTHYFFKDAFSKVECNRIIDAFSSKCNINSKTFNNDNEYRKSTITWIPYNHTTKWIYDKIMLYATIANNQTYNFDVTSIYDKIQFACYNAETSDKYDTHIDIGSNNIHSCRKLSISVQLSPEDSYRGGNLKIRNIQASREQGSITVFPSFLEHLVEPIESGKRYSLVLWLYGPHYK